MSATLQVKSRFRDRWKQDVQTDIISFREPNGMDLINCGMPWRYETSDEGQSTRIMDTKAMSRLIVELSNAEFDVVYQMTAAEFVAATGIVLGFFLESRAASPASASTDISSLPSGGEISA